jgi:hypothetical protein
VRESGRHVHDAGAALGFTGGKLSSSSSAAISSGVRDVRASGGAKLSVLAAEVVAVCGVAVASAGVAVTSGVGGGSVVGMAGTAGGAGVRTGVVGGGAVVAAESVGNSERGGGAVGGGEGLRAYGSRGPKGTLVDG